MNTIERPVTIAVSGAHSTGKSTFLARLAHELRRNEVEVATVADLGEHAQHIGLPILYNHTYTSTLWIIARGISNEVATWPHTDVLLVDRAVPDALGYYLAALAFRAEEPDQAATVYLRTLVAQHSVHYDLMFRTALDRAIPIGSEKPRDNNSRYRQLADHHVGRLLADLDIPHKLLTADGHDAAIAFAVEFAMQRLAGSDIETASASPIDHAYP